MKILIAAALLLAAPQEFPRLSDPILDDVGALDAGQRRLADDLIRGLERSDSTQVALVIVATTGGRDIADYALETARLNRIGKAGHDNGVLIVVAMKDRRVRIEVGSGLEGKLTDALCGRIIRDEMVPRFRDGRIGEGACAGLAAVVKSVRGEYRSPRSPGIPPKGRGILGVIILAFIILSILSSRRRLGGFGGGFILGSMIGGRRSWGGGGGGGGGWSGGGGGFGGGGASGSW